MKLESIYTNIESVPTKEGESISTVFVVNLAVGKDVSVQVTLTGNDPAITEAFNIIRKKAEARFIESYKCEA